MIDICEDLVPPIAFEEGILFVAGATVAVGAITAMGHAWKQLFGGKNEKRGMER